MEVGRFELAFRNRLSEVLSSQFGSHPYFQETAFRDSKHHNEALQKTLQVFSQTKDQRAKHYRTTYTEPPLPPIWILKEFLTFGATARFYAALASPIRTDIARAFGVTTLPVFDSWIQCFVDLRNICAHHDRLFNRRFQKQPQLYKRENVPNASAVTLKAQLECLDHVLCNVEGAGDLVNRVQRVINRFPEVQSVEVGY
jgi:abortive infection bacteriophage resistance protein